jgi:hypothetical protein
MSSAENPSVWEQWGAYQAANIPGEHQDGIVVPDLIMRNNNVPEELRPHVERIWDDALKRAIDFADHAAKMLTIVWRATHDAPE